MQETTGAALTPLPASAHLLEPVLRRFQEEPTRPMVAVRRDGRFVDLTVSECYGRIRDLAKGLIGSGVQPGDRVVIMSKTRLEWVLADYAILAVGAATVPVYETSSAEQVQWVVSDSGAVMAIMETGAMRGLLDEGRGDAPICDDVLVIDDGGLDALVGRGVDVPDEALDERIAELTTDTLAAVVYTSGTTGRSKGCVLTHGNLRTNVRQSIDAVGDMIQPGDVSLLFLPLAHVLTKIITFVGIEAGVKGVFGTGVPQLPEELKLVQPTMVVAVPRVFEKVYNTARHTAASQGKEKIFDRAADVAIRWSRENSSGKSGVLLNLQHALFDRLVYRKLKLAFGGRMRYAISGGGPLGERLTHFFNGVGVQIFEGYGLTETSPTLTINTFEHWEPGTVGRPVAGTVLGIAPDGEILAKGPQVFQGYWQNDIATKEVKTDDGWFHTGDMGSVDEHGFVKITGRKKELLVTAAGKNVAPAPLEDRLRAHPIISQAVVVGDARPFIAALLALDEEAIKEWADDHGMSHAVTTELHSNPELLEELQAAVDDANKSVSKAESIRKFVVLPRDLSVDAGELTPTLKVRRAVVAKTYAAEIEGLYE
ncbi:MAG TPA: long-chain fatty acid--CoA ligase [Acidimicrobiales bacterium]|nr:long-chain fatty acid--CoA ligase [Acidimicrobiales bacterium]